MQLLILWIHVSKRGPRSPAALVLAYKVNWPLFATRKDFNYMCNIVSRNDRDANMHHQSNSDIRVCRGLNLTIHDDVIKWKHFPRNWPFVREIHRSPVNCPHKGQWRGALMFSLIYAWINDWVNNREAGDLRRQHGHYDVIVMRYTLFSVSAI